VAVAAALLRGVTKNGPVAGVVWFGILDYPGALDVRDDEKLWLRPEFSFLLANERRISFFLFVLFTSSTIFA
jgi:hypothetical protein